MNIRGCTDGMTYGVGDVDAAGAWSDMERTIRRRRKCCIELREVYGTQGAPDTTSGNARGMVTCGPHEPPANVLWYIERWAVTVPVIYKNRSSPQMAPLSMVASSEWKNDGDMF